MFRLHLVIFGFFLLFICLFFDGKVLAQERGLGISIDPFLSDLSLQEGEKEKIFSITISNASPTEMNLDISAIDFGSLDFSAGNAFLGSQGDIEKNYQLAEWLTVESGNVSIPAGEKKVLQGKIINTETLSPGGHYGAILFYVREKEGLIMGPTNVAIDQRLSALVFLKKYGGERFGMELTETSFQQTMLGKISSINVIIQNTGNIHIVPRGLVEVFDPMGRMVSKGVLNENSFVVLPGAKRNFLVSPVAVAKEFFPGKYSIRLHTRYDGKDDFAVKEWNVFLFPPVSFGIIVALIMAGVGYKIWRKRRKSP